MTKNSGPATWMPIGKPRCVQYMMLRRSTRARMVGARGRLDTCRNNKRSVVVTALHQNKNDFWRFLKNFTEKIFVKKWCIFARWSATKFLQEFMLRWPTWCFGFVLGVATTLHQNRRHITHGVANPSGIKQAPPNLISHAAIRRTKQNKKT